MNIIKCRLRPHQFRCGRGKKKSKTEERKKALNSVFFFSFQSQNNNNSNRPCTLRVQWTSFHFLVFCIALHTMAIVCGGSSFSVVYFRPFSLPHHASRIVTPCRRRDLNVATWRYLVFLPLLGHVQFYIYIGIRADISTILCRCYFICIAQCRKAQKCCICIVHAVPFLNSPPQFCVHFVLPQSSYF